MNKISVSFDFDCVSVPEQKQLAEYFTAQGLTVKCKSPCNVSADGDIVTPYELTSKRQVVETAVKDWKAIAAFLNRDFSVKIEIFSFLSQDFHFIDSLIEYCNHKFRVRYSDCYDLCFMSDFDDYQEFCDKYGDGVFTEEEFEDEQDSDYFVIEKDDQISFEDEVKLKYTL